MYVDSLRNKYPMVQAKVNYNVSITLCRRQSHSSLILASANKKKTKTIFPQKIAMNQRKKEHVFGFISLRIYSPPHLIYRRMTVTHSKKDSAAL